MALSIAQEKTVGGAGTSISATFDSALTEDDLLEASVFTRATNLGNPTGWTTDVNVVNSVKNDVLRIASKLAGAGESTTVTFTTTPSDNSSMAIREINGHDAVSPIDKTASTGRTAGVTSLSSGTTAALSQADEICFADFGIRGPVTVPSMDNSYTLDHHLTGGNPGFAAILLSGHRIVSATTAQATTASWTTARDAMGCIATYKESVGLTGQAALAGVGTVVAAAGLILPATATLAGTGALTVSGTIGGVQLGAAALSGAGSLTAAAVTTLKGEAVLNGEGSLTAIGERGVEAVAVLAGAGTLTAVGETGLEGRAALSGVGSLTVTAERIITGVAALPGVGSLTVGAVATLVGSSALAGAGTLTVIGDTGVVIFTPLGQILREVNPADYPPDTLFSFEVMFKGAPAGKTVHARFFNITTATVVVGSEVSSVASGAERKRSSVFTLASGANDYRAEFGGVAGGVYLFPATADLVKEKD